MSLSVFAAAAEAPDRAAVVTDDATLTFADLARRVRGAVAALRDRGLAAPAPVALVAEQDVASLVTLHALVALGTPALLLHPRLTMAERGRLLDAAEPAGMVEPARIDGHGSQGPRTHGPGAQSRATDPTGAGRADPAGSVDPPPPPDDGRALAIVHTSGTSGAPRGVILSRRAFAASAAGSAANLGWEDRDRWLLPLPVAHVGGLSIVTRCLLARRAVVLTGDTGARGILEAVRRHRVTLLSLVPTQLARILALDDGPPPASLRAVLLGGAPASPALLRQAADREWPVLTTYGLTEACSQAATQPYGTVNRGQLGAGRPLPSVELRIGQKGTIELRGPTLLSGYIPAPSEPPVTASGWFDTGDRGRIDDNGCLHVLGRRSDTIITGGENVDPGEVEQALEGLPAIDRACVFGLPDPEWGEVVCAAVVLARDPEAVEPAGSHDGGEAPVALRAGIAELRAVLAPFKLPRRVAVLEALPLNPTGKVDRRETARQAGRRLQAV